MFTNSYYPDNPVPEGHCFINNTQGGIYIFYEILLELGPFFGITTYEIFVMIKINRSMKKMGFDYLKDKKLLIYLYPMVFIFSWICIIFTRFLILIGV